MDKQMLGHINWELLLWFTVLFVAGIFNLYSASGTRLESGTIVYAPYYQKQIIWAMAGLVGLVFAACIDYHRLYSLAWIFYLICLVMLILVPFIGSTIYGAKRWISLGPFNIQPSEMMKLAVLVLMARILSHDDIALGWKRFFYVSLVAMVPVGLIVKQPDLGTAIMIVLLLFGMIAFHGIRAYVIKPCLLLAPCFIGLMWFVGMHDYQRQRVLTFLDPSNDPRGTGYHVLQSRIAIGSGELTGKGFGSGTQSQLRFLPERHSDFAIAVLGEEWGFIGCLFIVIAFCGLLIAIFSTVTQARDRFGSMLAVGVFFYFFWQICINMGMVIGLMPVVGIPLPFISYGGSATIVNFALVGIVLGIAMRRFMFKSN